MVAIVSGNGLGLSLSSLATLGQRGVFGNLTHGRSSEGVFVNVANGNLVLQGGDDRLVGRGEDLDVLRTYNSQGQFTDDNADNWAVGIYRQQMQLSGTLGAEGSVLRRTGRDAAVAVYDWDAALGVYRSTSGGGAHDRIVVVGGEYIWSDGDSGASERYEIATGRLVGSADRYGNSHAYTYDGGANIASIANLASGETVYYDYSGNNLTQVRTVGADAVQTTRVRYTYDGSNRLSQVIVDLSPEDNSIVDGRTYVSTYTYDGASNRVATVAQSDGTQLTFTYTQVGGTFCVASVKNALNQSTTFSYNSGARTTTVTDPLGVSTVYAYDVKGQLTSVTEPAVNGVKSQTGFVYNASGDLTQVTDAEGRMVVMEYDNAGNQTVSRDSMGNTVRRVFDAANRLIAETVFAVPDPDGAGASQPGQARTTRYVYDEANKSQLRFVVSAQGRVAEHRYNDYGERVTTIAYADGVDDLSGLDQAQVPSEAQMQTWVAGCDLSRVARTDYSYDHRGQLQQTVAFAQTDALGEGIADAGCSRVHYVHDRAGHLLSTVTGAGGATQYVYDGLGRVLSVLDAAGRLTLSSYDDTGRRVTVVQANGLRTIQAYDQAGRLISVQQSDAAAVSLGTTQHFYDSNGRLLMSQDPTGIRQWVLYDAQGRKAADIDGNGSLIEYVYNKAGQLAHTIRYATAVNTALLVNSSGQPLNPALSGIRPAANAADRKQWNVYDGAGRLHGTLDASGALTRFVYDGASRVVAVQQYAVRMSVASLGQILQPSQVVPTLTPGSDRVSRRLYDGDGLLIGTLDAEGFLTEMRYDGAGRLACTMRYANPTPQAARAGGSLADLRPSVDVGDQITRCLYDAEGQLTAQIDAEGFLSEYIHDANGNVTETVRYANRVDGSLLSEVTTTTALALLRPLAHAQDRTSTRQYDALDRLISETDHAGITTQYAYDTAGNRISSTRAAGTPQARSLLARFDLQGRLIGELSARGAALLTGGQTQAQIEAIWAQYGQTHSYDAAGLRTSTTDANGYKTLFFYNADGQRTHTVNALGEVSESQYNVFGERSAEIRYGNRISTTSLTGANAGGQLNATLTAVVNAVKNATLDSRVSSAYDVAGRLITRTDAGNFQTSYTYNAFGEETGRQQPGGSGLTLVRTTAYDRRGLVVLQTRQNAGVSTSSAQAYDAFGRLIQFTDAAGYSRTQSYDRLGRTVTSTNALGCSRSTGYDAFGQILSQTDELGKTTRYAYDPGQRSVTVTSPEGIVVKTVYTPDGDVQTVTDGRGGITTYQYDADGRLISVQRPEGVTTSNAYDRAGRLILTTDANAGQLSYSYDAANRVLTRTQAGAVTTYAYDGKGQQIRVSDPNGVVTQLTYDLKGQLLSQAVDPTGLNLVTRYTYDGQGNTLQVTQPTGSVTLYAYDAAGRRISERVDPTGLNLTRSYIYDKNDNLIGVTDPNGNRSYYGYDEENRRVFTVDGAGGVVRTFYDAAGRIAKTVSYCTAINTSDLDSPFVVGPMSLPDIAGRIESRLSANPARDATEHRVYDGDARLKATVNGLGEVTRYWYDANGNVIERRSYANRVVMTGAGAWVPGTDPAPVSSTESDQRLRTVYDGLNRAVFTVNALGAVTAFQYDAKGNLLKRIGYTRTIDPATAATANAIGQAVISHPASSLVLHERNVYDRADRLIWSADGVGAVTQRIYDRNGNLIKQVRYATPVACDPQASASSIQEVKECAQDVATDHVYDAANRRVYEINALGGVTQYVYDRNGNKTMQIEHVTQVDPPKTSIFVIGPSFSNYDSTNIVSALGSTAATASGNRVTRWAYDAADRLVFQVNALSAVTETLYGGVIQKTRRYAVAGNMANLSQTATAAEMRARVAVNAANDRTDVRQFDAAGRLSLQVDAGGYATRHVYDGIGRLIATTRYAAVVGAADGVTVSATAGKDRTNTFVYDSAGRLVSSTDAMGFTESHTYDGVGNKSSFTNKSGSTWTYDHDAAGRLVREISPEVKLAYVGVAHGQTLTVNAQYSGNGSVVTAYSYDALGRMIYKREALGRPEQRNTQYGYDALGRQVRVQYHPVGVYAPGADNLGTNGVGGLAERTETITTIYTTTTYDVFGNAVSSRDSAGNYSHKAYDVLGRLIYDIDSLGAVTGYTRNIFGDTVELTRYGQAVASLAGVQTAPSSGQVKESVRVIDASLSRIIRTEVDKLGRTLRVTQPSAAVYDSNENGVSNASAVTQHTYNAFGELTRTAVQSRVSAGKWNITNHYYDKRGLRVATVDTMGYLTTSRYDCVGNLLEQTEYATAISGWNGLLPPAAVPTGSAHADNRTTQYAYDLNNRLSAETRKSVKYSANAGATHLTGDLSTLYGYDAVGNRTLVVDAAGGQTRTYYDALGRIAAVVGATVNAGSAGTNGGTAVAPVTTFLRDGHGNVVSQTAYAQGSTAASGSWPTVPAHANDRVSLSAYDALGRVVQTTNAAGVSRYLSYDAGGHIAKQWQAVSMGGVLQSLWSTYEYDSLGRLMRSTEPGANRLAMNDGSTMAGLTHDASMGAVGATSSTQNRYNVFGEVIAKSLNGVEQEWFRYDGAGHLLATNTGDGQVKFYLYDLQGRKSAEIRSAGAGRGNLDLGQYTTAQQVVGLSGVGLRRTDYVYDGNGHVIEERQPERQVQVRKTGVMVNQRPIIKRTYDRWGNVLTITDPRDETWKTVFTYNANNQVIGQSHKLYGSSNGNGSEIATGFYYDALGRQSAVKDGRGNVNAYARDYAGNVIEERHADGGVLKSGYNAFGDKVFTVNELGQTTVNGYDSLGQLRTVDKGPVNATSFDAGWQESHRVITRMASYGYDEAGRRTTETNGNDEVTAYRYDLRGNLVRTTHAMGATAYAYDNLGRKIGQIDGNNKQQTWTYDYFGLVTQHKDLGDKDLGSRLYSYEYDNARQLHTQTSTAGQNLRYAYDAAGQQICVYDWSGLDVQSMTWDSTFQGLTHLYDYDLAGNRVLEQTLSWGKAVQGTVMDYDSLGRLSSVSNVTGYTVGVDTSIDTKTYMAFNGDVFQAWQANSLGMGLEEYALYHYGKYGYAEANRVTGKFTPTTLAQRSAAVRSFIAGQMGVNKPYAVAAYLLEHRITLAEAGAAVGMSASALASYFSARGLSAADYTVAPTEPVPPDEFVVGPTLSTPAQIRAGAVSALWSVNYHSPRAVATAMLEWHITPEELAFAANVPLSQVHGYFAFNGIDRSNYDLASGQASYDSGRSQSIYNSMKSHLASNNAAGLAAMLLTYRISLEELTKISALNSQANNTVGKWKAYFAQNGVAEQNYNVMLANLPQSLLRAGSVAGSVVTVNGRLAEVQSTYQKYVGKPKELAAAMLLQGIGPQELAAGNGLSVASLQAMFKAAGVAAVNYTPALVREVNLTRGMAYRERSLQQASLPQVNMTLSYDGANNRTVVETSYTNLTQLSNTKRYYQYDQMNRQTVVDALSAEAISSASDSASLLRVLGTEGHLVGYDRAGNRQSDTYKGDYGVITGVIGGNTVWKKISGGLVSESYGYDNWGRLQTVDTGGRGGLASDRVRVDLRWYDAAGRVVRTGCDDGTFGVGTASFNYYSALNGSDPQMNWPKSGNGLEIQLSRYNASGWLLAQRTGWSQGNFAKYLADYSRAGSYDGVGNVLQYTVAAYEMLSAKTSYAMQYSYEYEGWDSYQVKTINGQGLSQSQALGLGLGPWGANGSWKTADSQSTKQERDRNGYLLRVSDSGQEQNTRRFVNNADGVAVQVRRGQSGSEQYVQQQLVVSGQVLGRYGQSKQQSGDYGWQSDINFGYRAVGSGYPASTPQQWVVGVGDTLQSIAKAVYGEAGQWYLIAQANGLVDSSELRLGQSLQVPSTVGGASNNAQTYRPYEASAVIGELSPTLTMPASAGGGGCGGLGQLLMVVVAVVVTVYTAGAAATAMSSVASAASAAGTSTWSIGAAALQGAYSAGGLAAAMIGSAAGSVASQVAGNAMGVTQGLSWKSVALAALSGGVGAQLQGFNLFEGVANSIPNLMARAAVANAMTQTVAVATGLQKGFDWKGVAASAAGAGAGAAMGQWLQGNGAFAGSGGSSGWGTQLARGTVSGMAAGVAAAVARGGKVVIQQVATDAFGNALGQTVADNLSQPSEQEDVLGKFIEQQEAAQAQRDRSAALYGLGSAGPVRLGQPAGAGAVAQWSREVDQAIGRGAAELAAIEQRLAELAPQPLGEPEQKVLLADSSGRSPFTGGGDYRDPRDFQSSIAYRSLRSRVLAEALYQARRDASPSLLENFGRGWSSKGSDWSVLEGEKPLSYSLGSAARTGLGVVYDGLTGADSFEQAGQAWKARKYGTAILHGMQGVGTVGLTAMTLGDYALAKAGVTGIVGGTGLRAAEVGVGNVEAGAATSGGTLNLRYPVATNPNEAFFWSGRTDGVGGEAVARQIAESQSGTTLEALIENRGIQMPKWDATDPAVVQAWKDISADYAKGTSGTVRAVIGQSLRPGNVWEAAELGALKANPRVTQIVTIDPVTKVETVIFKR